jgi:hypothetical protein
MVSIDGLRAALPEQLEVVGQIHVFKRTRELSFEKRLGALSAEQNDSEAAIITEPVESPLWYVNHAGSLLDLGEKQKLLKIANEVIEWSNGLTRSENEARRSVGSNGGQHASPESSPGQDATSEAHWVRRLQRHLKLVRSRTS